MLPWVIVPPCSTGHASGILQLFEPFSDHVGVASQPAVVTFVGWEDFEDMQVSSPGIYTRTSDALGEKVICNFLNLSRECFPPHAQFYAKQTFSVEPERTTKLVHQLCLEFSDVICIRAQTINDAIGTMLGFRNCIQPDNTQVGAQFVIFIEESSYSAGTGDESVREQVWAHVTGDDAGSQWMLNIVERMTVHFHHPLRTAIVEILIALENSVVAMRERRKERGHLWTYSEIMFLVGEYLHEKTSSVGEHRILPIQAFRALPTWYPMAFRRQIWPGQQLLNCNGLTKWLLAVPGHIDLEKYVAPIFARMFLVDRTLLPQGLSNVELFAAIYGPLCRDAWHIAAQRDDWPSCRSLQCFLDTVALRMGIYNSTLERDAQVGLREVGENSLCCLCPWDMAPFIYFPCGHGICERDAWRFSGARINHSQVSTLTHFRVCPVCGAPADLTKRHRPLQAGFRVASIDGGGVFAFVPNIVFREIPDLPSALSPHHYLDVIVGTSGGSITGVTWGIKQWPLSHCIDVFRSTAARVFDKEQGWIAEVKRSIRLCLFGAIYDIAHFGQVMIDHVGDVAFREMYSGTKECSVRVAIPTTTFDASLCLYRSYGDVVCTEKYGKHGKHGKSQNPKDPLLWQAYDNPSRPTAWISRVVTSCAAPLMFEPLPGVKEFDGFIVANCPAYVAMMEANKLSLLDTRMLDFHVSFGTGRLVASGQGCSRKWVEYFLPEWIRRLTSCMCAAVDTDAMYEKFWNTLDKAEQVGKHHRIEPEIAVRPLARDDPAALSDLEMETMRHMALPETVVKTRRLRLAMLASCFFCTLLSPPQFDSVLGRYCVHLTIQSRWPEDDAISQSLHEKLKKAFFVVDGIAHPYRAPLVTLLYVDRLDVPLHITLTLDGEESHAVKCWQYPPSVAGLFWRAVVSNVGVWNRPCDTCRECGKSA